MRIIKAAHGETMQLCGTAQLRMNRKYGLSRYVVKIPCDEGVLLFHTLSGELLLLESNESANENMRLFVGKRYMVPVGSDEDELVRQVQNIAMLLRPNARGIKSFTILTTTDCNARCSYCYETGRLRHSMSRETALDVASYIARVRAHNSVSIAWFGGEPLYNQPAIDVICKKLNAHGIALNSTMITNGFYLVPELSSYAVGAWNLNSVQITLDGTREVYANTKAYIDACADPLARVLGNIEAALHAGIRVLIRLNMDKSNASDLLELVEILGKRFQGVENLYLFVALLRSFGPAIDEFATGAEAAAAYFALRKRITELGFERRTGLSRGLKTNRCMADNDACEVILPDGRIGKCEHCSETDLIGSIYDTERDSTMIDAWKERLTDLPECRTCALYPRCILLKKCDWNKDGCPESTRLIRMGRLKESILREYEEWKKNQASY